MIPLNWKPPRIFFGWWIVGAAFFIALYAGGAIFYGFTVIFEPIANEMGWSYTQVSLAASLRGMEMGILAPLVGTLADRWGPKRLISGGAVIAAIGLILLGRATSLGMYYVAYFLMSIGMSGCTTTVLMTAAANWFHRKVGLASGIVVSGFGFGGLLIPVMVWLIDVLDWRMTIFILALNMLVVILPLSLLFRHKPEQYGYFPDGQQDNAAHSNNTPSMSQSGEVAITIRQTFRSNPFWCITLAFVFHMTVVSSIAAHVMPYLSSINIARSKSSIVATAIPLMSIVGRLGLGWLADKVNRRLVAAVSFAMTALGMLCFGYTSTAGSWILIPFLLLFGIGYGGCTTMRPYLTREYFGRVNFGAVFGFIIGINMLGTIIGPPLVGWVYDNWGSYQSIWFIFAALPLASLMCVLAIRPIRTTAELAGGD